MNAPEKLHPLSAPARTLAGYLCASEPGVVYHLREVICAAEGLNPEAVRVRGSSAYHRLAHVLSVLRKELMALADAGVEIWLATEHVRRVLPGHASKLAVQIGSSDLSWGAQRFVQYALTEQSEPVLSLSDSICAMLGLSPALASADCPGRYRIMRARRQVREAKDALVAFGINLSGRGDEVVTVKHKNKKQKNNNSKGD